MKTLTKLTIALLVVLFVSFTMTSCGNKGNDPQPVQPQPPIPPTPVPVPNPNGGGGTCTGLTTKDFFIVGSKWVKMDTVNNLQHGDTLHISSTTEISKVYYNGVGNIVEGGTYTQDDCLKATINLTKYGATTLKFADKDRVYLVSQKVDYNSIDWTKAYQFYKRVK